VVQCSPDCSTLVCNLLSCSRRAVPHQLRASSSNPPCFTKNRQAVHCMEVKLQSIKVPTASPSVHHLSRCDLPPTTCASRAKLKYPRYTATRATPHGTAQTRNAWEYAYQTPVLQKLRVNTPVPSHGPQQHDCATTAHARADLSSSLPVADACWLLTSAALGVQPPCAPVLLLAAPPAAVV
jgi:hypothetical protein